MVPEELEFLVVLVPPVDTGAEVVSEAAETTSTPKGPIFSVFGRTESETTNVSAHATVANVFFN
jgi:hypothetical protein